MEKHEQNDFDGQALLQETEDDFSDELNQLEEAEIEDSSPLGSIRDIYPRTPVAALRREFSDEELSAQFSLNIVAALVGMAPTYIAQALDRRRPIVTLRDVLYLLDLDAFSETFVPRSRIPTYLLASSTPVLSRLTNPKSYDLILGSAKDLLLRIPPGSVQCVVTSTPYWGTRIYSEWFEVEWADGERCPFGHEQTPEAFIRHTIELLYLLKPAITVSGSVWWNLMDTYNTRTQIRENAAETLRAMQGQDERGWKDFACRRYSAGHSFLKDGEQCLIPQRIAERAARIGYWTKSIITWKKANSMPETVSSRVTREVEYIIHLSVQRTPYLDKRAYNLLPPQLGGRNHKFESEKITDIWSLPTSTGQDGHGAQFPIALPSRCIAISTRENDLVLDPFVGGGTTALAALRLDRRVIGFDVSEFYLNIARQKIARESPTQVTTTEPQPQPQQLTLV